MQAIREFQILHLSRLSVLRLLDNAEVLKRCMEGQADGYLSFFCPRTSILNQKLIFIGLDALYNGNSSLERFLLLP